MRAIALPRRSRLRAAVWGSVGVLSLNSLLESLPTVAREAQWGDLRGLLVEAETVLLARLSAGEPQHDRGGTNGPAMHSAADSTHPLVDLSCLRFPDSRIGKAQGASAEERGPGMEAR